MRRRLECRSLQSRFVTVSMGKVAARDDDRRTFVYIRVAGKDVGFIYWPGAYEQGFATGSVIAEAIRASRGDDAQST